MGSAPTPLLGHFGVLCSLLGLCKGITARLRAARALWQVLLLSQHGPKRCKKRHQKPFWSSLEPPGGKTPSGMRLGLPGAMAPRDGLFQKDTWLSLAGVFLIILAISWSSDLSLCDDERSFISLPEQLRAKAAAPAVALLWARSSRGFGSVCGSA